MKNLFIVSCIIALFSCTKSDKQQKADYFAFGTDYGFCGGNCAHFYSIKDGKVYPDDMERFNADELIFKNIPLADKKYLIAKQLLDSFPAYLEQNANKTFGCPDCYDQGKVYIEYKINGNRKFWLIDTNEASLPEEIREYIKIVKNAVTELEQ